MFRPNYYSEWWQVVQTGDFKSLRFPFAILGHFECYRDLSTIIAFGMAPEVQKLT